MVGFQMVGWKNIIEPTLVLCGTLFKSVSAVGFLGEEAFLESVSFHSEMLGATNFGLVLGDCLVNAMICIKNIVSKFSG